MRLAFFFCMLLSIPIHAQIVINGIPWFDQHGKAVNAHGGSIIRDGGRYWLFGEYKSDTTNEFSGFSCYSSNNLTDWQFERIILPIQHDGLLGPRRVGERAKVVRCPKTGEYVMFMHTDALDYNDPHIGIATSRDINGNYEFRGTLNHHGKPIRQWDMGVFQDDDGTAYLLIHHGPIYRLSDDYLTVDTLMANVKGMGEAPVMFKKEGIYYLLTSQLTSWERNDNYYFTAHDITGPWSRHGTFCPMGTLTWNSQSTFVLMLPDGTPMYMGDRWSYPRQGSAATYVWMPLQVDREHLSIPEYWQAWNLQTFSPVDILKTAKHAEPLFSNVGDTTHTVCIPFHGSRVALTGKTGPHGGYAYVSISNKDGKTLYSSYIDFYSKKPSQGIRVITPPMSVENYLLKVTRTGERPVWTDKSKRLYGSDSCLIQLDSLYILPEHTYMNPIVGGDHPDPTIVRVGKDYYMTHSSMEYQPGLTIYHSRDLIHWQPIGSALHEYLGAVWAPDICRVNGQYHIYFTVSKGNDDFHNYVVTSSRPEGPWSRPIDLHISHWIDPCYAYDEDAGQHWLFLSGGHRIRLSEDGCSTIGAIEKIYDGWKIPKDWIMEGKALEGPKIKKIGKYYYMISAEGGTAGPATTHMAVVARAESLDGPWENSPGNPFIHTYSAKETWWSKGHASLIDTPDGHWWSIFHAYRGSRVSQGRQTLMEPVSITPDGWLQVSSQCTDGPFANPLDIDSTQDALSQHLTTFRIGKEWKCFRDYNPQRFLVDGHELTILGKGADPATSSPLLFTPSSPDYEMSVRIDIDGDCEAGIVFLYDPDHFAAFGGNKQVFNCWRRGKKRKTEANGCGRTFWIKMRYSHQVVTGWLSLDGLRWCMQPWALEMSGFNHNTFGGFMSLLPGLYCHGKGKACFSHLELMSN